jgi:hypothetical protein
VDNFDFGPKDFDPSTQGIYGLEPNIAFEFEFNSLGHFLYGFSAIFFFIPSFIMLLASNGHEKFLIKKMQLICDTAGGGEEG